MFKGLTELGLAIPPYLTRFNNEELFFRPSGPLGAESRIYSYPAKAKIRRRRWQGKGVGGIACCVFISCVAVHLTAQGRRQDERGARGRRKAVVRSVAREVRLARSIHRQVGPWP